MSWSAIASPVTSETDGDGPALEDLDIGGAWGLLAGGRLDASAMLGQGTMVGEFDIHLQDLDASGAVLPGKSSPFDALLRAPESAAAPDRAASQPDLATPLFQGGLLGLIEDQQQAFLAEARQWLRTSHELAAADGLAHAAGDGSTDRLQGRKGAQERLLGQEILAFVRDNRYWLAAIACTLLPLVLGAEYLRQRLGRSGHQRRQAGDRRHQHERRTTPDAAAPKPDRRGGEPRRVSESRRTMSDRRGPQPAPR